MTNDEKKAFFAQVKGKKIRLSICPPGEYFIPEILAGLDDGMIEGEQSKSDGAQFSDYWWINNGFQRNPNGEQWEYLNGGEIPINTSLGFYGVPIDGGYGLGSEPQEAQKALCSCSLEIIMQTGCNCGGV